MPRSGGTRRHRRPIDAKPLQFHDRVKTIGVGHRSSRPVQKTTWERTKYYLWLSHFHLRSTTREEWNWETHLSHSRRTRPRILFHLLSEPAVTAICRIIRNLHLTLREQSRCTGEIPYLSSSNAVLSLGPYRYAAKSSSNEMTREMPSRSMTPKDVRSTSEKS